MTSTLSHLLGGIVLKAWMEGMHWDASIGAVDNCLNNKQTNKTKQTINQTKQSINQSASIKARGQNGCLYNGGTGVARRSSPPTQDLLLCIGHTLVIRWLTINMTSWHAHLYRQTNVQSFATLIHIITLHQSSMSMRMADM
jgi:molybdopterin biosynthesis enzyme MoaB